MPCPRGVGTSNRVARGHHLHPTTGAATATADAQASVEQTQANLFGEEILTASGYRQDLAEHTRAQVGILGSEVHTAQDH